MRSGVCHLKRTRRIWALTSQTSRLLLKLESKQIVIDRKLMNIDSKISKYCNISIDNFGDETVCLLIMSQYSPYLEKLQKIGDILRNLKEESRSY